MTKITDEASKSDGHSNKGQFRPGRSGNPRGRPKGPLTLRSELEQILKERIGVREGGKQKRISRREALFLKLVEQALHGDLKAASTIIGLLVKLEPKAAEQAAPSETLSDDDNEIVADFLRGHQQVIP